MPKTNSAASAFGIRVNLKAAAAAYFPGAAPESTGAANLGTYGERSQDQAGSFPVVS